MDVIHVLGFQINLISLDALDFKGFKCIIAGGVAKVENRVLVIMKGEMVRNLYRLMGDVIPGRVIKETLTNKERKYIVQVDLDVTKSSEDGLTGSSKISSSNNPRRPKR